MISPLLELLGLCDPPLRIQGERYVEIAVENDTQVLRGRMDVIREVEDTQREMEHAQKEMQHTRRETDDAQ